MFISMQTFKTLILIKFPSFQIFGDYYLLTHKRNWEMADKPNEDITNALKSNREVHSNAAPIILI